MLVVWRVAQPRSGRRILRRPEMDAVGRWLWINGALNGYISGILVGCSETAHYLFRFDIHETAAVSADSRFSQARVWCTFDSSHSPLERCNRTSSTVALGRSGV